MTYNYIELNNELTQRGEDGFFQLDKDLQARDEFLREVKNTTKEFDSQTDRYKYLITNNFYYDAMSQYSAQQIEDLHELAHHFSFKFASFMAAERFYKQYALKTDDKKSYLETYEEHVCIVALYLAQGRYGLAVDLMQEMMAQRYQPATPTFMNAGRARRGELVSCFLLETGDSLNDIDARINESMQLSKLGGGVAVNLSKLRARGEDIKGVKGVAKGAVPVAKLIQTGVAYADQLGQRPGAAAVYLNIFHADVEEFLDSKKINADESLRLSTVSLGLIVPSKFFELAAKNEPYYTFYPHNVQKVLGEELDDIDLDTRYEELVNNPDIARKELNARAMLTRISTTQLESGYPYIFFKSNSNKQHALKALGNIKMSNLCVEIHQLQETSIYTDYGEPDIIKRDISCNLGSLNIVNVMENAGHMEWTVKTAMNGLTAVSELSNIKNAPGVKKANDELHSVGLGVMNLHGYLAKNGIRYDSEEAKDFARAFFSALNYHSIRASSEIAIRKGQAFEGFEKSEYATGEYFTKYLEEDFSPKTEKVKELLTNAGFDVPSRDDWANLMSMVKITGLYHAYRLAIAPTGSISYVQNATASVMPITDLIERRTTKTNTTYYPAPYLSPETQWFYKSAYDLDQKKFIDLMAEIQVHVDQGISTTLHVNSDISTKDLSKLYMYAHKKGLKSLYYTRTRVLGLDECVSCAV